MSFFMKDKRHAMIKRLKYRFSCLMLAALLLVAILPAGTVQAAGGSVTITTASLGSFKIGRDGVISALNAVGGTVPYTWSSTDLPAGLSVGNITGTISGRVYGTPTAAAGTYSVHITCTDSLGASDTKAFGLTVRSSSTTYTQMETTSTSASIQTLATGYVGAPYSQSIGADVTVSQLPPGLSYDASLGLLSGTPIAAESFQVGTNTQIAVDSLEQSIIVGGFFLGYNNIVNTNTNTNTINLTVVLDVSTDWVSRTSDTSNDLLGVVWGDNTLVAVGKSGTILTSPDGAVWTPQISGTADDLIGVAWGNNTFVAVGTSGTILTSPDGVNWTVRNSGTSNSLTGIAWGNGAFVATGAFQTILTSPDGSVWTDRTDRAVVSDSIVSVTYGDSTFAGLGYGGDIYTSPDGESWTGSALLNSSHPAFDRITWGNNNFTAVGSGGDIFTSPDGAAWTAGTSGTSSELIGAACGNSTTVAVGDSGTILASLDGTTWSARTSGTSNPLVDVAWGNNTFVAVGVDGTILQTGFPAIVGTVKDSGNDPIAGADVSLTVNGSVYSVQADTNGIYKILNVPAGADYTVTASKSGYDDGAVDGVDVTAGTATFGADITLTETPADKTPGGGNHNGSPGGGGSAQPQNPTAQVLDSSGGINSTIPVTLDSDTDTAAVEVDPDSLAGAFAKSKADDKGVKTIAIEIPKVNGAKAYEPILPASFFASGDAARAVEIKTCIATVTVPGNMLSATATGTQTISLTIAAGDGSKLEAAVQAQIGDRPVIELTMKMDGRQTAWNNSSTPWNNGSLPVTVTVPYTPTVEELANSESIAVWYIDGSGKSVTVPNGRYDAATGAVTFAVTHFSQYAVGYNKADFKDVPADAWYNKAVGFIAARTITAGTGNGNYSPESKLTRGDFLVLMMRAYDIAPDESLSDNFSDAGSTYYTGYLAAAKRSGISAGVGNNMFAPGKEITRQEMFTLLYNALKAIGRLPQGSSGKMLSDFTDAGQVDSWAEDAMMLLVETETVGGSGGKLAPTGTATRAEMAQVLYNLLSN